MAICGIGKNGQTKRGCGATIEWLELVVDGDLTGKYLAVNPALVEPDGTTYLMFQDGTTGFRHYDPEMRGYILHRETCPVGAGRKKPPKLDKHRRSYGKTAKHRG